MNKLSLSDLWSQLKKRKVVRVALIYLVVGLAVMLAGIWAFEGLGLPDYLLPLLLVLVFLGFPIALVLAWVYEITPHGIRKDSAGQIESIKKVDHYPDNVPSIAVLPFADLSENEDQGYFCEGLAEELLDSLRKVPNLRVASRVAAFQLDARQVDFDEVGRKLHVQTELKGACRKSGEKLHINAELINTIDGTRRWSREFKRPYKDIFEIQEEIEATVLNVLDVAKHEPAAPRQWVDPKAYDLFLHGLSCFAKHTTQDNVYARQLFLQAIDFEPEYGRAWAALAYTYGYSYMYFNATDVNLAEAKRTSKQALKLRAAPGRVACLIRYRLLYGSELQKGRRCI